MEALFAENRKLGIEASKMPRKAMPSLLVLFLRKQRFVKHMENGTKFDLFYVQENIWCKKDSKFIFS